MLFFFFFFNDTATTEIYTLSLHDALPICWASFWHYVGMGRYGEQLEYLFTLFPHEQVLVLRYRRSEEHTSELQSRLHLVCRLLLEKKKKKRRRHAHMEYTDHIYYDVTATI